MHIHRLQPSEWHRLRSLRLRALLDAPDAFSTTVSDAKSWEPEHWEQQIRTLPTFIAHSELLGDVGMVRGAEDDAGRSHIRWLISCWVAPEARRHGVGSALVTALVHWAKASGAQELHLDVAEQNTPAIALYRRHGFRDTGLRGTLPPPRDHVIECHYQCILAGVST